MKECSLCGSLEIKWTDGDRALCEIHFNAYEQDLDPEDVVN